MSVKTQFALLAGYNQDTNTVVRELLDKQSNDDREKSRGSYYDSASGLARHIYDAELGLLGMLGKAVPDNADAQKALQPLAALPEPPKEKLGEADWKAFKANFEAADKIFVAFAAALKEADADAPVQWFHAPPETVTLSFMVNMLTTHGTHHRGQISQILDEQKVDHDFSGINPKYSK
jgi:uncharacterized damage-inducible protein DinB